MPRLLSEAQIAQYRDEGYLAPIRIMDEDRAVGLRAELEAVEARMGGPLRGDLRHKSHLLFPFLADLVRHPPLLDAIEDVLGPNLLCWTSNFFIKEAANPAFVSWHQDSTYWGLDRPDVVTAWVALTPSNKGNGAMEFIPGTHTSDQIPHRDTFAKNNLLTRCFFSSRRRHTRLQGDWSSDVCSSESVGMRRLMSGSRTTLIGSSPFSTRWICSRSMR